MKKKKLIALGLVAVMAASLAACGSSDSSSSDDSSSSSGSSDSDKVITFWNIAVENPDALIMQYAVDQYIRMILLNLDTPLRRPVSRMISTKRNL